MVGGGGGGGGSGGGCGGGGGGGGGSSEGAEQGPCGTRHQCLRRRVGTNLQNAYMYLNSIGCNLGFLLVNGTLHEATHADNLRAVCSPTVLAIVAIMASVGMVTTRALQPSPSPYSNPRPNPNPRASPNPHPQPQPQPQR